MTSAPKSAKYGTWNSPIDAESISKGFRLIEVIWDDQGRHLIWLEGRSDQTALVCQGPDNAGHYDLSRNLKARTSVMYGGGDFGVSRDAVYIVSGRKVFQQRIDSTKVSTILDSVRFPASPTCSPDGHWLALVTSTEIKDYLSITSLDNSNGELTDLIESDFCMQPTWHPDGRHLACVTWKRPFMPWEKSSVRIARVPDGDPGNKELANVHPEALVSKDSASFQPLFSPNGEFLSFICDDEGWFNLLVVSLNTGEIAVRFRQKAEHALPAWIQNMRTCCWSKNSQGIYVISLSQGISKLFYFDIESGKGSEVKGRLQSYTHLTQLTSSKSGELALIGSSAQTPPQVLRIKDTKAVQIVRRSQPDLIPNDYMSSPETVRWVSADGQPCYGLVYPPRNPGFTSTGPPPALIKIHGGPTSQYYSEYDPDTQFFTSRGFLVLALNYRGSSGFGREYRELLRERWGVVDVEDVHSAYQFLKTSGRADPGRVFLAGGSAGGFTLLLTLIRYPGLFRASICRYGVSNLVTLAEETHKFEASYFDSLIGALPEHADRYRERSPLNSFTRIQDPVAVFQGTEDKVVPRNQSDELVASLAERGVPHVYRLYPGEGHGWRKQSTLRDYYETIERFLADYVG